MTHLRVFDEAGGAPLDKKAASAALRRRKGAERRAEQAWRDEVQLRARAAFKRAIAAAAEAALPAPSPHKQ